MDEELQVVLMLSCMDAAARLAAGCGAAPSPKELADKAKELFKEMSGTDWPYPAQP